MRDSELTVSYLITVLRIPESVCELDDFFLIQTLASFDLESVVLRVIDTYIFTSTIYRRAHKHLTANSKRYVIATVLLECHSYRHPSILLSYK